jgi:cation transport ATPase
VLASGAHCLISGDQGINDALVLAAATLGLANAVRVSAQDGGIDHR